jgi:uncharacterized protein (UPF0335 family)
MINIILADAIKRIEMEVKTNPDNYTDIYSELQELMFVMRKLNNCLRG